MDRVLSSTRSMVASPIGSRLVIFTWSWDRRAEKHRCDSACSSINSRRSLLTEAMLILRVTAQSSNSDSINSFDNQSLLLTGSSISNFSNPELKLLCLRSADPRFVTDVGG